jgi:YVTN family beta-propeller protein
MRHAFTFLLLGCCASGVFPDIITDTIPGSNGMMSAVVVNPVTNKVYFANYGIGSVGVLDAATHTVTTVRIGDSSLTGIALNAMTNTIYVGNPGDSTVAVMSGRTGAFTKLKVNYYPRNIAVNPVTNMIYVTNYRLDYEDTGTVTIINGATNASTTVKAGLSPFAVAVNPVTNKIYVTNDVTPLHDTGTVTIIDGASMAKTSVTAGYEPIDITINPVTNKCYVAFREYMYGRVIDGATNTSKRANYGGLEPSDIAVNPLTNKVYISGYFCLFEYDGATDTAMTIECATQGFYHIVAINPATNKVYAAGRGGYPGQVLAVDGATRSTIATFGLDPSLIAVNPITNKIFVTSLPESSLYVIDGNTYTHASVSVGETPVALAVNPVTNKAFIANRYGNTMTVLDGATRSVATIGVGKYPAGVAVNPATNTAYVINAGDRSVTAITGATNLATSIPINVQPSWVTVNSAANMVYVVSEDSNSVTVLDGASNKLKTLRVGARPRKAVVNPVTNKIYVPNYSSNSVTVINGATLATSSVPVGNQPAAAAINPATNKVYVVNYSSSDMTVIDGATNARSTVGIGPRPFAVAVNAVTNTIYVLHYANADPNIDDCTISVIRDATGSVTEIKTGYKLGAVWVNPLTNKIFINGVRYSPSLLVLDGATNSITTVGSEVPSCAIDGNAVTSTVYLTNNDSNTVTIVDATPPFDTKLAAKLDALPNSTVTQAKPPLLGDGVCRLPGLGGVDAVLFRNGSMRTSAAWSLCPAARTAQNDSVRWQVAWEGDSLFPGENFLCAAAINALASTTINIGNGTPFIGNVKVFPVYRTMPQSVPGPVVLMTPYPGDTVKWGVDKFTWKSPEPFIVNYQMQIGIDSLFAATVVFDSSLADTALLSQKMRSNTVHWWRVRAKNGAGWGSYSAPIKFLSVSTVVSALPKTVSVNIANCSAGNTSISYALPSPAFVHAIVFDFRGRAIAEIVNRRQPAGRYILPLAKKCRASGFYFLEFTAGAYSKTVKVLIDR